MIPTLWTNVRRDDPATSQQGAWQAKLSASQVVVLACFEKHGPMTDAEMIARIKAVPDRIPFSDSRLRSARNEMSAANEERLAELVEEWTRCAARGGITMENIDGPGKWARRMLATEGYRGPLISTGQYRTVHGRRHTVWTL